VAGGLLVQALLIGAIGLALGMLAPFNDIEGILPFYAVLFLLAIPLIGCPPLVLAGVAAALIVAGPVLLVATAPAALPYSGSDLDPNFGTLVHDPLGLLVQLLITGEYPVLVYLSYICAGLAIGRLDLTSRRVGWWLLGGGMALAVAARATSALLLYPLGGLAALISASPEESASTLLWQAQNLLAEAESPISWWYLALPAPHSHTPVDLLHTLGSAGAVLGAALLLTRVPVMSRALSPVAAVGTEPTGPTGPVAQASGGPHLGRYCELSEQVDADQSQFPDNSKALLGVAGTQLTDMPLVAPSQIRGAVTISVNQIRAEAGEPAGPQPDDSALDQAEGAIATFEEENCP
jgi:hypothetical protein